MTPGTSYIEFSTEVITFRAFARTNCRLTYMDVVLTSFHEADVQFCDLDDVLVVTDVAGVQRGRLCVETTLIKLHDFLACQSKQL